MTPRSYLYVPGDAGKRLWRSTTRGADVVIADLEDSATPTKPPAAREEVAAWLASATTSKRMVRLNAGNAGMDDLRGARPGEQTRPEARKLPERGQITGGSP